MTNKHKRGFTLIELLVVVAILGLLATIVAVSLTSARARARDSRRVSDLRQLELALELYYAANQEYPDASSTSLGELVTDGYLNMNRFPVDPTTDNPYCYVVGELTGALKDNQFYHLGAVLENTDSDMLTQDRDYDPSSTSVDWSNNDAMGPDCSFGTDPLDFIDGADDTTDGVYDRGVFPQS